MPALYIDLPPFHFNPVFLGVLRDGISRDWHSRGICTSGHLYECNNLKSFEKLRSSFGLPSAHFFKYLQIRDYISVQQGGKLTPLEDLQIDIMMQEKHFYPLPITDSWVFQKLKFLLQGLNGKWTLTMPLRTLNGSWFVIAPNHSPITADTDCLTLYGVYMTPQRLPYRLR